MTITINVPVFPMRKEIAARKRRRGLLSFLMPRRAEASQDRKTEPRYTAEGLEFDVTGLGGSPFRTSGR